MMMISPRCWSRAVPAQAMDLRFICIVSLCYLLTCTGATKRAVVNGDSLQIMPCVHGSPNQQWDISHLSSDQTIRMVANSKCIDISNFATQNGGLVGIWDCHTEDKDPTQQNQEFIFDQSNTQTIRNPMSGRCLDTQLHATLPGSGVQIWDCSSSVPTEQWVYNSADMTIRNVVSGMCLDCGSTLVIPPPCDNPANQGFPFCNTSLSAAQRAADLVSRLHNTTKILQLQNSAPAALEIPMSPYQWWNEALHGVAASPGTTFNAVTPSATSFPQVITTAASFDADLFWAIGNVVSTEARAFANVGNAGLTFWAPNLNIFRDPRWGRGQETPGEDPYLTSIYVDNFVRGMQFDTLDPTHLKVSSCCKHYAAYSLEDWGGVDRYHFNAIVTQQDLHDTYLPAFESCISPLAAGASGIMCSYNAVNGVPSCADDYLLIELARNQFGFNGYITSDCSAVDFVLDYHHYTNNTDDTCLAVLAGGMDIECGNFLPINLAQAVSHGVVDWDLIDSHLINNYAVLMRLGMFDPADSQPFMNISTEVINSPDHQALALTAAREGIVLMKNAQNTLPISSSSTESVTVLGPNGNATNTMQADYAGPAPYLISPLQGISSYVSGTTFVAGCAIASNDTTQFDAACQAASKADATIIVAGLDQTQESEAQDRTIISWPGVQQQFIAKMSVCAKRPVILVILCGGPIDISAELANPDIGAILWAGYPGQSGGQAIADVIFGAYAPAGRLDHTWYPASFASQVSMFDMGMRPNASSGNPGRTYRFYTGQAVLPFGFGLSYTNWTYTVLNTSMSSVSERTLQQHIADAGVSRLRLARVGDMDVVVKNTGSMTSDVSVLVFAVGPTAGENGAPLRSLVAFKRLHSVKAGESEVVHFPFTAEALSHVDANGKRTTVAGEWRFEVENVQHVVRVN